MSISFLSFQLPNPDWLRSFWECKDAGFFFILQILKHFYFKIILEENAASKPPKPFSFSLTPFGLGVQRSETLFVPANPFQKIFSEIFQELL
jgi:hypothetical protein